MLERLDCAGPCGDVVEFGCGYGTFTIPAAKVVSGRVHALDIEAEMMEATAGKCREAGLTNVATRVRDFVVDGSGLESGSVGYAMLFNILHIEDPVGLLKEAYRVLAPGGKAGIIHWRGDIATPRGPSTAIRPTAEQCREWGEQAGFVLDRFQALCCCSWHWGLVLQKPVA